MVCCSGFDSELLYVARFAVISLDDVAVSEFSLEFHDNFYQTYVTYPFRFKLFLTSGTDYISTSNKPNFKWLFNVLQLFHHIMKHFKQQCYRFCYQKLFIGKNTKAEFICEIQSSQFRDSRASERINERLTARPFSSGTCFRKQRRILVFIFFTFFSTTKMQ